MNYNFKSLGLFALTILGTFISKNASAQFEIDHLSFGAGVGFINHAQDIGGSVAYNIRAHYELDEKNSVAINFNSQLPATKTYEFQANAMSSGTNPYAVPVNVDQNISFYNISADYHRYFVQDIEESFGVYGLAGVGLSIANRSFTVGSYDQTKYSLSAASFLEDESFNGFMINLGVGTNIMISDKLALFGEGKIAIPAGNEYNSQGNSNITNPLPFNYSILAGVRFNVFD